jgi:beta-1,4-N-acetylglucosaminyltransferase
LGASFIILVTVGNSQWDFSRLVSKMDAIARDITEDVVMQIGSSKLIPKNAKYFRFVPKEEMDRLHDEARVVVSHAGIGSILTAIDYKKPLIIVPRMSIFNEMIDDHQSEISKELEKQQGILVIWDIDSLNEDFLNSQLILPRIKRDMMLIISLKRYIADVVASMDDINCEI